MKRVSVLFLLYLFFSMGMKAQIDNHMHVEPPKLIPWNQLGVSYTPEKTTIRLLGDEKASTLKVNLYDTSVSEKPIFSESFKKEFYTYEYKSYWEIELEGDYKGKYYTLQLEYNDGKTSLALPDPYAKAVGVNGMRGQIIDFSETNPKGWENQQIPAFKKEDVIIYETHIRDFSIAPNSGMKHKGKFLAFTEEGTTNSYGQATGIDHLKEMGITHLHILPMFDFRSIDESIPNNTAYNWGYDPQNYNALEGSYSSDPYEGTTRIKEAKEMIMNLHNNGIAVVMDVVYNHTGFTEESVFNQFYPGLYYRHNADGSFSNASACGNETASEKEPFRRYMIESLKWWMTEYKIDGFRFDLMGIHDIITMNIIARELQKINPNVLLYGEGWTAGDSPLPYNQRALKNRAKDLHGVAVFSDDIRDGIKGHWSNVEEKGFVSGNPELKEVIKFGIVGSTNHPQIEYNTEKTYAQFPYADEPTQTIGYVSCHDNNTLYDKLKIANPEASEENIIRMHKLANTIVLTSQGIPFLHMGVEMKRTKQGVENSYQSPDSINQMDWDWKHENKELVQYYNDLITLRKKHPAFSAGKTDLLQKHLHFIDNNDCLLVAYTLDGNALGDSWNTIYVAFNGEGKEKKIQLPDGKWNVVLNGNTIDLKANKTVKKKIKIPPYSGVIVYQD